MAGVAEMTGRRSTGVPAGLAFGVLLAMSAILTGCGGAGDRGQQAAAVTAAAGPGESQTVAAAEPSGPLAGEVIPEFATPAAASDAVEQPQQAAEPGLPAPSAEAQLVRLVIPKARVNHKLTVKGLTARREMEDPGGKDDVAWYTFSTLPGHGSNAVFSGHVDWYTGERGVFWFLRNLQEGDEAEVQYSDGMVLKYRVAKVAVYGSADAPVEEITGPTTADILTLITCDGVFSRSTGDYNKRRVVVAERVG